MRQLSNSAIANYGDVHWNEQLMESPAKSGVYQTRNDRNQTWFKYFDANYGLWYMSCAELKENAARNTARISAPDIARQVVAWARCSKKGGAAFAVEHRGKL